MNFSQLTASSLGNPARSDTVSYCTEPERSVSAEPAGGSRRTSERSYDSIASTIDGNEHGTERNTSLDHALDKEEGGEQDTKGKNKKGIKTIFKKLHKSKKEKPSNKGQ